jgi:hypothetical protein
MLLKTTKKRDKRITKWVYSNSSRSSMINLENNAIKKEQRLRSLLGKTNDIKSRS